jgi:hypothetical protein
LAEAFSLYWLPSSPRQPHSPLERILFKTAAGSIGALQLFAVFVTAKTFEILLMEIFDLVFD